MRAEPTGPSTDEQLMARIADDDRDAFEELYDRYCGRAYGLARTVCREPGLAEKAVQEGFVSVWTSRGNYSSQRGTVTAWLLAVVCHHALEAVRSERDEAEQLKDILAQIPERQREVITLAYFGQLTHTEIATQLSLPPGTVKGRMRLGLKELQLHLDDQVSS